MYHPSVSLSPHTSSLEDSSYSEGIHCPAVGMITPVESCESRLSTKNKDAACSFESCPRFRPTVATIKKPVFKKRTIGPNKKHKCVCCDKIGKHHSRGLCKKCYEKHKWHKTLDMFPLTYSPYVFEEAT